MCRVLKQTIRSKRDLLGCVLFNQTQYRVRPRGAELTIKQIFNAGFKESTTPRKTVLLKRKDNYRIKTASEVLSEMKKLRPEYRCSSGMRIVMREEGDAKKAANNDSFIDLRKGAE